MGRGRPLVRQDKSVMANLLKLSAVTNSLLQHVCHGLVTTKPIRGSNGVECEVGTGIGIGDIHQVFWMLLESFPTHFLSGVHMSTSTISP